MSVDHSGHRLRLKKALNENGIMTFSPHEVIELMLYTALPRRDVNEMAHKIDDAFGGVNGLIRAKKEELLALGLSEKTADTLKAYTSCIQAYTESFEEEKSLSTFLRTQGDLEKLFKSCSSEEKRMLALLSTGQEVLQTSEIDVPNAARVIAEKALIYDAAEAVVVCRKDHCFSAQQEENIKASLKLIDVGFKLYTLE